MTPTHNRNNAQETRTQKLKQLFSFALVGGIGTLINTLLLHLLSQKAQIHYLLASILSTEMVILLNFAGNNYFTFKNPTLSHSKDSHTKNAGDTHPYSFSKKTLSKKFLSFQLISMISLLGTLFLLWFFVTLLGKEHLLVWNVLAITIMFASNYLLNAAFTWKNDRNEKDMGKRTLENENPKYHDRQKSNWKNDNWKGEDWRGDWKKNAKRISFIGMLLALFLLQSSFVLGDAVAVSQLGYHPSSIKEAIVYTSSSSGTVGIRDSATNALVATFPLERPKNFDGSAVNCQGNMPCLIADFTDLTATGNYYAQMNGINSPSFSINQDIFEDKMPLFFEFFNAQLQQGSSYHGDMHSGYSPAFTSMSDGSFIMVADHAALTLIRLGSAYRRNPQLFQFDRYNILSSGKPDIQEYLVGYSDYLKSLQGVSIQEGNSANAVRLDSGMLINTIFVPGPTSTTSMDVYIPGSPPTFLQTVPVISLCGANTGNNSASWQTCMNNAALFYKCQMDEPCLNLTYNDRKGIVSSNPSSNGYGVARGWAYDFGCYFDVDLNTGGFNNGKPNPCQFFDDDETREHTSMALLGFLEAWPAVNDYSPSKGQELLARSIQTYDHIKNNYPAFSSGDADSGFFGAAAFLLYDYTDSPSYLVDAHAMRGAISSVFISDSTHGNEFYWEEYARHKDALTANGLNYQLNGVNPEEFFRGKMYHDYKDAGPTSISNNGERVFQFNPDIHFQNSRYMLTEGVIASKTAELVSSPESFISLIAQSQLAWLTGKNMVQQGAGLNAPAQSMSFIFGIGNHPSQFHSRWLIDTGYSSASAGKVIGVRGTAYQFLDPASSQFVYFDGVAEILGNHLGANGNGWHGESSNGLFNTGKVFKNGNTYIPGWISGAFPAADGDTIFNYDNTIYAFEYTETTNEIIATAIESLAYLDGNLNNKPRHDGTFVNVSVPTPPIVVVPPNATLPPNVTTPPTTNTTNTTTPTNSTPLSSLTIQTSPGSVAISLDSLPMGTSDANGVLVLHNLSSGNRLMIATKTNFTLVSTQILLAPGSNTVSVALIQASQPSIGATITGNSTDLMPSSANGLIQYHMREDATALFTVTSSAPNEITWFVDGVEQTITSTQHATFSWSPGVLWVPRPPIFSNIAASTIIAQSSSGSVSWVVQVENVINPFFSSQNDGGDVVGSADSKVRVLTNNKYIDVSGMNVTLVSDSGSIIHELIEVSNNSEETEWAVYLPQLTSGNNFLTHINGFENSFGGVVSYTLDSARAHYVTPPASSSPPSTNSNPRRSSGGGSGGGGSSSQQSNPELIYALFQRDVVDSDEYQTLTLDAKNFNGGIFEVTARLNTPDNNIQTVTLDLIEGTRDYGTWAVTFEALLRGDYDLDSVSLYGQTGSLLKTVQIQDHTFYSLGIEGDADSASEALGLIFAVLSQNKIGEGGSVTLSIDARDGVGITEAFATIVTSRGEEFITVLELTNGENTYGTWEGTFIASMPDTTYTAKSVTLKSAADEKTYELTDRSVYVDSSSNVLQTDQNAQNKITGASILSMFSKEQWSDTVKKPLVPTILGLTLMFIVIGGTFLVRK